MALSGFSLENLQGVGILQCHLLLFRCTCNRYWELCVFRFSSTVCMLALSSDGPSFLAALAPLGSRGILGMWQQFISFNALIGLFLSVCVIFIFKQFMVFVLIASYPVICRLIRVALQ